MTKSQVLWQRAKVADLMEKLLSRDLMEVKPVLNLSSEGGFSYPEVEKLLETTPEQVVQLLETLAGAGILLRRFSDKVFLCPYCQSPNLRPSLRCAKCGSGYIDRARIMEHFACGYTGPESEFMGVGKYVCPRCKRELKFLGTDYRSLGIKYICGNCAEIFGEPIFKWQCLGCLLLFADKEAKEIPLYVYYLDDSKRKHLEFELGPKKQLLEFLESRGYEMAEGVPVKGKSGAEHTFDIVARKTDSLCTHTLAIETIIAEQDEEVDLGAIFSFDEKAYDAGIHDKILIVSTKLSSEASRFAERQRVKVLTVEDLEKLLSAKKATPPKQISSKTFSFESKAQLIQELRDSGYSVKEKAKVWGRSGVEYDMDVLAEWDDGIIRHSLGIGVLTSLTEVSLEAVALFDTKAYDVGIHEKVLLVSPKTSREAIQFTQRQKIKVFEVGDAKKLT